MTRTFPRIPSLPLFIALGIAVAVLAFGATRWYTDTRGSDALPSLDLPGDAAAARSGALDAQALFATRAPATVMIDATIDGEAVTGAGVIVDADGTIVTASHVIFNYDTQQLATNVVVSTTDDGLGTRDELQARIVSRDKNNDLAVLKVDPTQATRPLVAAKLSQAELAIGSDVAAIGYPMGERWTQTVGTVSNVHRTKPSRINAAWNIPDAIQFDAPINKGNSGGPLFNARGEVVGIVQQISSTTESNTGISFAISAQIIERVLRLAPDHAIIPYSYTGITSRTLSPQLAKAAGIDATEGALVQGATGPAELAGLSVGAPMAYAGGSVQKGDVIVEVAERKIESSQDLDRLLGLLDPRTRVEVVVVRDGARHSLYLEPQQAA